MHWTEIFALTACLATILGAPIAFALYLGGKIDSLRKEINDESRDFHARMRIIEEQRNDRRKKLVTIEEGRK